jgi:hypothetical protein
MRTKQTSSPFGPMDLPIEVGMLPEPEKHPFAIAEELGRLMGSDEAARHFFRIMAAEQSRTYDIVHYAGDLAAEPELPHARLVILQVPSSARRRAGRFAEDLARSGPAVLAISSDERHLLDWALVGVYGGIVHDRPLDEVVAEIRAPEMRGALPLGSGLAGVGVLLAGSPEAKGRLSLAPRSFDRYFELARSVADRAKQTVERAIEITDRMTRMLHVAQRGPFETQIDYGRSKGLSLASRLDELTSSVDRARESGGAMPLSADLGELTHAGTEAMITYSELDEVDRQVSEEAAKAPRVLNANFAAPDGAFVDGRTALVADRSYDLLVDVGPVWDRGRSIVRGASDFPTHAMPPTEAGGWNVDVVFISEDFTPRVASRSMFVPKGGRSFPIKENGTKEEHAGPVSIPLRAPSCKELRIARGRLALHYEGSVIQSAVVEVSVAPSAGTFPEAQNSITVDYVLSGPLGNLDETFGARDVGLSVMMNDDGGAGHRFVLRGSDDPLPAFIPYDPDGARDQLDESRTALLGLFYAKDRQANTTKASGLAPDNGKSLDQFKLDLFVLARIGNRLRAGTLPDAQPEDGGPSAEWRRSLAKTLLSKRIIQVARTHKSSYVYPWSLLYQHSLEGDSNRWSYCKVIDEQWQNGRRTGPPDDRCPYNDSPDDHINRLCPYGFWGLKHIVEQPVSLRLKGDGKYDPSQTVATKIARDGGKLHVAVGLTTDPKFDAALIRRHLDDLGRLPALELESPSATDVDQMLDALESPQVAYFLCHGMYDPQEKSVFLNIGPVDAQRAHRIYPSMLDGWTTRLESPNLKAWTTIRPLVFINGCDTAGVQPEQMLTFISAFSNVPSGGIIGTEVSVQLPVAIDFAGALFGALFSKPDSTAGEAMRQARWQLANKGNLLGLAYTMYCMANLQFV